MAGGAGWRLTRRGRAVVAAAAVALASGAAGLVGTAGGASAPPAPPRLTVVREDDTLWVIARRELPGLEPYQAVDVIRRLNGITDYTIHPGQHLRLPPGR